MTDYKNLLDYAVKIARAGGQETLKYFKKDVQVQIKDDASPVTEADQAAERVMRKLIQNEFPGHGILGEEFGLHQEDADVQWILDPIDGTVGFIHGIPLYTTLVGVTVNGEPVAGVICAPYMDELVCAAKGHGAWFNGKQTKIRKLKELDEASLMTSDVQYFDTYGYKKSFNHLLKLVRTHRTWGDAYGHLMVATGRADIMLDPVLSVWDAGPLLTIITEAGGAFTDLEGNARITGGNGIGCPAEWSDTLINIFKTHR